MTTHIEELNPGLKDLGRYEYGWADSDTAGATAKRGLGEDVVRDISGRKNEPEWMLDLRLKSLRLFDKKPMPAWGSDLTGIDFQNIKYFVKSTEKQATSWEDLPADIKNTYDRLGIPEAEKQRLVAGVAAQYESEVVYHQIREDLEEKGVIFLDTDTGLREHEDLFREYFTSVIPAGDNKFASLNTAVWSGGSFIYVPPGVHVDIPLQAYFRINTENMGQFERTLIIADEGSYVHYVEGCTAPIYSSDSLHSAVVEIIVKKNARVRYTTIQNWSNNVYNLVTKRATARRGRDDGVDRRQHRLQGDDEVPRRLPPRRAREGRDAVDRLRRRGPAPGRRRQDGPPGAQHLLDDRLQVGRARRWPHLLPRPGPGHRGRPRLRVARCGATRCSSTRSAGPTPTPTSTSARTTSRWATRRPSRKVSRGPAVLPPCRADMHRGGGHGHDRARVRRAHRARAAHGVRPRAQPAHRAADGRSSRLMPLLEKTAGLTGGPSKGAHTDSGAAFVARPVPRPSAPRRSTSPTFPIPNGREEEWRFTPVDRLRSLLTRRRRPRRARSTYAVDGARRGTRRDAGRGEARARDGAGPRRPRRGRR